MLHVIDKLELLVTRLRHPHQSNVTDVPSHQEILAESLRDPAFRAEGERTALARAGTR